MKGIDVSKYQGTIDWKAVKADGVGFAIIKVIGANGNKDEQFDNNWNGCVANDIPIYGVYNYSYATTVDKAKADAKAVLNALNGRTTTVWLDIEDSCMKNLGSKIVNIIDNYRLIIESAGCKFGVYTGLSFYNTYLAKHVGKTSYAWWVARYPVTSDMRISSDVNESKKPSISNDVEGWQYSSKGRVSGIKGYVDLNEWYAVEKQAKLTNEQVADQVIAGAWGVNPSRAVRLKAAGYDYEAIRKIVNQKLSGNSVYAAGSS